MTTFPNHYTTAELADLLGVGLAQAQRIMGQIGAERIGRAYVVRADVAHGELHRRQREDQERRRGNQEREYNARAARDELMAARRGAEARRTRVIEREAERVEAVLQQQVPESVSRYLQAYRERVLNLPPVEDVGA